MKLHLSASVKCSYPLAQFKILFCGFFFAVADVVEAFAGILEVDFEFVPHL